MNQRRCLLYLGVFLLMLPQRSWGQTATSPGHRADDLLHTALPILKEVLGESLPETISPLKANAAELEKTADPELEAILRFGPGKDAGPEALFRARENLRALWAAYYAPGSKRILLPSGTGELVEWIRKQTPPGGQPAEFLREFVQLALVHEAVRQALDRRYDLAHRFAKCQTAEETQALQALAEGRALVLTRQIARRLGSEYALPLLTERYRQFVPSGGWPHAGSTWVIEQHYRACAWGLAFFDFAEAQRIPDAERRVFTHPPAQVSLVQRPELYWQVEAPLRPGLEGRLARQVKTLPHWQWDWAPQPWTPDMVRDVGELLGAKDRAEKVVAGWQEAGCIVWRGKRNAKAEVAVGAVRLADDKAARAYYALSIDLQREQDKLLNSTPGAPERVIRSTSESIAFEGAEDAVKTDKQFQVVGSDAPPIAVTTLLVRTGDLVVLFTWRDQSPDPDWAGKLLGSLKAETPRP